MPISKRNSLGRFEKTENIKFEGGFTFPMQTGWSAKIILIVGLVFLVSPWIFMVAKNNTLSGLSTKVNDFYDVYFTCSCPTNGTANSTDTSAPNKNKGNSL